MIVTDPLRKPAAVGVKVTLMVHPDLAARLVPQLLVCAKLPLATILKLVTGVEPLLTRMTVCAGLVVPTSWPEKERKFVESSMATPWPSRSMVSGVVDALSVTVRVPKLNPDAVGVKEISMLQNAAGPRLLPQLFDCVKSPLVAMLVILTAAEPLLKSVAT